MKLNREHAAALREALPYLWDGVSKPQDCNQWPEGYICRALNRTTHPMRGAVMREILARLNRGITLQHWLLIEHGITGTDEQYQANRRAWMLLMIQEGES